MIFFVIFFSIFLAGFFSPVLIAIIGITRANTGNVFLAGFFSWLLGLVVLIILAEIWIRMAYNRWFYEFTDTNLKLERGVIWKRYSNVPYERVQNVDIHRGIIARMLGFSSVIIQTAGYSAMGRGGGVMSEGYLPAIDIESAEKIRDFLMKKISRHSRGGL